MVKILSLAIPTVVFDIDDLLLGYSQWLVVGRSGTIYFLLFCGVIGFCSILGFGGNMVDNLVKNGMQNEHAYQNLCRNILVPT